MLHLVKCLIPTKKTNILDSKELNIFHLGQNCLGLYTLHINIYILP